MDFSCKITTPTNGQREQETVGTRSDFAQQKYAFKGSTSITNKHVIMESNTYQSMLLNWRTNSGGL